MSDDPNTVEDEEPKKKSKLPMLIGIVLMLVLGGGGFFAVYSGMLFAPPAAEGDHAAAEETTEPVLPLPDVGFVPIEPLVINVIAGSTTKHLRFNAQLEVPKAYQDEVAGLVPRVIDIFNGYLRAVDVADLENPAALVKLRAQLLRRVQVVLGEGRVRDVLIMEFVVN